jgi:hypothetical protein
MKKINQNNGTKKLTSPANDGKPTMPLHDLKTRKDPRGGVGLKRREQDGLICTNHNELFVE